MVDNKNKNPEIDQDILNQDPPDINEPQVPDPTDPDNIDPNPDPIEPADPSEPLDSPSKEGSEPETPEPVVEPIVEETQEQKDLRYKAQQTETQIQAQKNKNLIDKVDEASKIAEPTVDELKAFVSLDGVDWDELTTFEQSMAKKSYLAEKRFSMVNEAVQTTKKIDEWASKVDEFIDSTDGKPEFVKLSTHEADFRRFCMQEANRGVAIDSLLLPAFLNNLPEPTKVRSSLFPTGGGGEKEEHTDKITDAESASALRLRDPREYKRQLKAGKISVEL